MLLMISFLLLWTFVASSPTRDGTLAYFNNVYRSGMSNPEDGQIYYASYIKQQKHQAKIGENGEWSNPQSSKYLAERDAIQNFLFEIGGIGEVQKAQGYKDKFSLKLMEALDKEQEKSVEKIYSFGEKLPLEENEFLELKSSRVVPQKNPVVEPFAHHYLRNSINRHIGKYAVAFLNAHCFASHRISSPEYTITFGIHDDGRVDSYYTTNEEKDGTTQQINTLLDRVSGQNFDRKIQWNLVRTSNGQQAYILSVSFIPHHPQMHALRNAENDYVFWVRKHNKCQRMTFEEIAIGFKNAQNQ